MRLKKLIAGDIKFQIKYGFYFLYAVLTILYSAVLLSLPQQWRDRIATLLIFSDPAAMGMFFMGAIVLLEKSQRVLCTLAVSPVRPAEYILSKLISIGIISVIAAVVIAAAIGKKHIGLLVVGTVVTSVVFTLLGMIVATKITSLNQFILWTVPFELIGFGPAVLYLFQVNVTGFSYYPANICIDLVAGQAPGMQKLAVVGVLILILFRTACKSVSKMFSELGGAKL